MIKFRISPALLSAALLTSGLTGLSTAQAFGAGRLQETVAGGLTQIYDQSHKLWYGNNHYLNTPHMIATPDALQPGDGTLCYTGHHTPTVVKLHDELSFIGHSLKGFGSEHLYIHLSDGNLAEEAVALADKTLDKSSDSSIRSWCFRYQGTRDVALYDSIKELGWLGRSNAITTISEGDFHFRHSGSGRVTVYDPAGYQQAAKAVVTANPDYVKEVYLLDSSALAARILPNQLKSFAESGSGHMKMMSANDIVDDYYDRFYGLFRYTSPISYSATTGLIFASLYTANLGVVNSLILSPIGAFGAAVIAPHYLLSQEALEKFTPIEVPVATFLAAGSHLLSATGTAMEYGSPLVRTAGNSLYDNSQSGTVNGWATLGAIATVGATPHLLRFANWASFDYLGMAGKVFFGGALFSAGAGAGIYALLIATDWYKNTTDQTKAADTDQHGKQ